MVEEEKPDSVLSTLLDYVPDFVLDFLPRGLFLLLWVYLFDWMRRFALRYTNGSTWFSTFAALVMAIPMTEFFLINGMLYLDEEEPPPPPPAAGTRELIAAELRYVFTKPDDSIPIETTQEKGDRCFLRGLLVLVWLIAIDFGRRSLFTNDFGEVDILLAVPIVMWVILTSTMFLVMAGLYIEGLLPT
ncbi:uncharacterized protein LOC127772169 [Oryza glaberrima]|uniref:uncharacterized protein LOC127772169 n=1 Tax=Oryza glaberrima TaxID=4538 RepID=UPI00224C5DB0|nr:uncharacterized protein LOC127772169 [Oryza glaberrima]